MNDDELTAVLSRAGFSEYEAEAYLGLLRLHDASVGDLTDICSVPRARLYDVLRDLAADGYVETYEQDTLRARIPNVDRAVEELREWADGFETAADELEDVWDRPSIEHTDISVFQTQEGTIEKAIDYVSEANHVVQICASPAELVELEAVLGTIHERGVTVRIALNFDPADSTTEDLPDMFSRVATEARRCEANGPFVALIDGSIAVLAIDNELDGEYGLVVDDNTLTSFLHWFFQLQLWEPWDTLYSESVGHPETYVSVRQLIRDLEMLHTEDETVRVRVNGVDLRSHEMVEVEGEVVDVIYTDVYPTRDTTFAQQFIQAALRIRTGDGEYTVGGYGAVVEDIRAIEIDVIGIE